MYKRIQIMCKLLALVVLATAALGVFHNAAVYFDAGGLKGGFISSVFAALVHLVGIGIIAVLAKVVWDFKATD